MTQPTRQHPRLRGADVGIPARQLDFRHSADIPRYVAGDNRTATCFLAVLSVFFPPGEDYFVRSVNHFSHLVSDPRLRAEVAGFTGQEVIHSREHDRLNEVFTERGFSLGVTEQSIRLGLAVLDRLPARQRLAVTAFAEHFTATFAEETLKYEGTNGDIHPELRELWLWHALEELEHKSVSFDVLELAGNDYRERVLAALCTIAALGPALVVSLASLLVTEGALARPADLVRGAWLLLGPDKSLPRVLRRMPLWLRRDFHPDRRDTRALEQEWRDRLFGARGSLSDQLRRPVHTASSA
jgi:uncharacterized protein